MIRFFPGFFIAACLVCLTAAHGQTISVQDDIRKVTSVASGTTITLAGRSELRVSDSGDPLPGCTVNLNSPDAWLVMSSFSPSQTVSTFLPRVRINGSAAALGQNVRVVQYGNGAVVIPHASTFTPMEIFSERGFGGASKALKTYTYYNNSNLGSLRSAVRSFRLKRGYMATIAQQENGMGASKVYIAQDADLEMSALPATFDRQIAFIRVFPWRWVGKKGWAGSEGNYMRAMWRYNWNNNESSTLDREYVPIRQTRWWPDIPTQKADSTHLLGFNEPDRPDQANLTVDQAIAEWPKLMATGLRLGAPAVSDGGLSWLYSFIDRIDQLGYRVDFVPVHFYRANYSDWDLHVFLRDIHQRTGRPVWLTEFNNGANWTCCLPTQAENAVKIGQFIDMMNGWSPFVERYSVYNWVEDNRRMVWDDPNGDWGWPLAAGERYRDTLSPLSTAHEMPDAGLGAAAMYSFDRRLADDAGNGNDAAVMGAASFAAGRSGQALALDGSDSFAMLPPRLGDSTDFTFAAWVYWGGGGGWQRIFDLGDGTNNFLCLTPKTGNDNLGVRFTIKDGGAEQVLNHSAPLPVNTWTHVAVTLAGNTGKLFLNGSLVASNTSMTLNPVDVGTKQNFLGKSQFSADPLFGGRLDDVRFLTSALSDATIAAIATGGTPQFTTDTITKADASPSQPYVDSLASQLTGGTATFTKVSGPAWLTVAADGSLGGVPTPADIGWNSFIVRATAASGSAIDTATVRILVKEATGMVMRLPFDGTASATVGAAHGVPTGSPATATGRRGTALDFDGVNDLVTLPAGVANHDEITIAAWIQWDGGGAWQRIFDFGNDTSEHMFLTPKSGTNRMMFLIRKDGVESSVDTSMPITGAWTHVAVTISSGSASLFVNGVRAGVTATTLRASDIRPVINLIGDSQFTADPLYDGRIDEFVILNRAMGASEINAIAGGQAPVRKSASPVAATATIGQPFSIGIAAASDPDPGTTLTWSKATGPRWLTVDTAGRISGVPGVADAGSNRMVARATDPTGHAVDVQVIIEVARPVDMLAHFQFHNDAADGTGAAAATLAGSPAFSDAALDRAIELDGTDDNVRLGGTLLNGVTDMTIATRFRWDGGANFQRLFDFGNGTAQYLFLTPKSASNTLRFAITKTGNTAEQILETTTPAIGEWTHVAVTLVNQTGTLYVNGAPVATGTITLDPTDFNPLFNHLGKSQFAADPLFHGAIDDFRIHRRGLSAAEIRTLALPPAPIEVPAGSYEAWAGNLPVLAGSTGRLDDPDRDGLPNVFEYLFSSDPVTSGVSPWPKGAVLAGSALAGAPDPAKRYLSLSARVRKNRPGITLIPEAAATPAGFGGPDAAGQVLQAGTPVDDGEHEIITWYLKTPVDAAPRGFIRLRIRSE